VLNLPLWPLGNLLKAYREKALAYTTVAAMVIVEVGAALIFCATPWILLLAILA
jgi:hypothetical protein